MIEIRSLTGLAAADLQRLEGGYTSYAYYRVRKEETLERTVISLELATFDQPYTKRWPILQDDLDRYLSVVNQGFSLAAYDGKQMAAISIAEPLYWNRSLWVWEFHVDRAYQRRGIGKNLMDVLVEKARQSGLRVVVCETQNTNVPAINFYRAVGFKIDAIDLSYYTNQDAITGEVAIFMKRKLEQEVNE